MHVTFNRNTEWTLYYHLRSTVKRDRFFVYVYFSNVTVSQTTVSTEPMKMFRLEHETMRACQANVARFDHMACRFLEIKYTFSGFCFRSNKERMR